MDTVFDGIELKSAMVVSGLSSATGIFSQPTPYRNADIVFSGLTARSARQPSVASTVETNPTVVSIRTRTVNARRIAAATAFNIDRAITRVDTTRAWVEEATSIAEQIKARTEWASNDAATTTDRQALHSEVQSLLNELSDQWLNGTFGTVPVLRGGTETVGVTPDGASITINNGDVHPLNLGIATLDLTTAANATAAGDAVSDAIASLSQQRTTLDTQHDTLAGRRRATKSEVTALDSRLETTRRDITTRVDASALLDAVRDALGAAIGPRKSRSQQHRRHVAHSDFREE